MQLVKETFQLVKEALLVVKGRASATCKNTQRTTKPTTSKNTTHLMLLNVSATQ